MSGDNEKLVVLIDARETVVTSWLRDIISFGGLILTAYVLNVCMPPSGWLNFALAVAWLLWLGGKGAARKHKMRPAQVRQWLDEQEA